MCDGGREDRVGREEGAGGRSKVRMDRVGELKGVEGCLGVRLSKATDGNWQRKLGVVKVGLLGLRVGE